MDGMEHKQTVCFPDSVVLVLKRKMLAAQMSFEARSSTEQLAWNFDFAFKGYCFATIVD